MLIQDRYQLVSLIRPLDGPQETEIFECVDTLGEPATHQIMKVMTLSGDDIQDRKRVEFMRRENKALRSIQHFAIPKVPRDGFFIIPKTQIAPEIHCLVMEKFEGESLDHWLTTHPPFTQDLALDWLEQIIHCLHEVHTHNFIHRDIKPENIMLQPDGSLALIDFGAVRDMTPTYMAKLHDSSNQNFEGTGIYTIGYAPPEQIDGKTLPQSDFYALGRTFVHLVTGVHPRQLPIEEQTGALVWREQAPQIDDTLASFLDQLMEIAPAKRPHNSTMLRSSFLQTFYQAPKKRSVKHLRHKWITIGAGIGLLLLIAGIAGGYYLNSAWDTSRAELTMAKGISHLTENRFKKAEDQFKAIIQDNPDNDEAHYYLALACAEEQDYSCAETHAQIAINLAPHNWQNYFALGNLYDDLADKKREQKEYQEAQTLYKQAKTLYKQAHNQDPQVLEPLNNLARLSLLEKDSNAGLTYAQKSLKLAKRPIDKAIIYKNMGWAKYLQRNQESAVQYLNKSISLNPGLADPYCLLNQIMPSSDSQEACISLVSDQVEVREWREDIIKGIEQKL